MAQIVTAKSTYHSSSGQENTAVRYVDKDIAYLYPAKSALITLVNSIKGMKKTVDATKVEHLEKDTAIRWTTLGATTATASTTVLAVTDGTAFVAGKLVQVPNSTGTGMEVMLVSSVSSNNVTFSRGFGGTTPGTISPGAALRVIGSVYEEGGAASEPVSTNASIISTYTTIAKNAIEITNTRKQIKVYGTGNTFSSDETDAMIVHKEGINAALYWGPPATESLTGGPTGKPIRTTQSLVSRISTNVFNVNGTLTFRNFLDWGASVFEFGESDTRLLIASPILHQAVATWGFNRLQVSESTNKLGLSITTVKTPFGTFKLANDFQLKNGVSGQSGWGGTGFIIDTDSLHYLVLKNRDTQLKRDTKRDGADRQFDEIITEYAWQIKREERHGRIYGITDFQA